MGKLAKNEIEALIVEREEGKTLGQLSAKYGIGASAITYHCDRAGVIPPKGVKVGRAKVTRGVAMHASELKKIRDLSLSGLGPLAISKELGRPYSTVRYRLSRMALTEGDQDNG